MTRSSDQFLLNLADLPITNHERTVALIWWYGLEDTNRYVHPTQLCEDMEKAAYANQNRSRMVSNLRADKCVAKGSEGKFRIPIKARQGLDETYLKYVDHRPVPKSNAVLPFDLFEGTRGYIEKVVDQINASYSASLFDCCTVMCRRLLETLIIEVYEADERAKEIKQPDGHFYMFSGLLERLKKDEKFNLGTNALCGLENFKKLGNLSAHNRRYNAVRNDIDRVRDGMRIACEELLHLATLK